MAEKSGADLIEACSSTQRPSQVRKQGAQVVPPPGAGARLGPHYQKGMEMLRWMLEVSGDESKFAKLLVLLGGIVVVFVVAMLFIVISD